ncbi:ATP-binding cassette, sub-B (MDR TAP), member 8 [Rhizophlyctis rosea]|uniref:Mitochondrial potassium channel ATP-binding subunit n=1 Tax=Rhizophlyctis rosea TaxID=64517 RepID=A0AAD5SIB9_9FUNG|nr:ATP-binding cassette, sub-B (MDR TAP), member 8 [Rhizophlyctis rosea]
MYCEAGVSEERLRLQTYQKNIVDDDSASKASETVKDKETSEASNWTLIKEIWKHLRPDWLLLLAIVGFTTLTAAINIYTPIVIGDLISIVQKELNNRIKRPPDFTALNAPAAKLLGLFSLQGFLTFLDISLVSRLGENLSKRMRRELYSAILAQDMAFFDSHMQGEVVGRLTQDVSEFKHTFKLVITQGLKATTQIMGTGVHLIRISPSLTFTLLATMPFLYLAMNLYGVYLRKVSKQSKSGDSLASGVAGEAVANIRTVRAFASEDQELERYGEAMEAASLLNTKLGFHIGAFQGMTNASIGCMILVILYYGGKLVASGDMTGGQLMTYMVSTQNLQRSLALVGVLFGQVIKAFGSAARVFEYVHLRPDIPIKGGIIPAGFEGRIEFRNVEFTYPTRPEHQVLRNLNLVLPVGKVVALCGPSGSGKSTIAQLVERFYDADRGQVLIDGVDVRHLDPSWLRRQIGYIGQEPILFATTVYENIRYGRPDASREEVEAAARQANAADFISKFPDGYETVVGERGVTLSGGQKQRIAIARALLKDPKVLILDEATSALDTQSERLVQEALDKLMEHRTVLVIAHRLSTIRNADVIVVLSVSRKEARKDGNVVEMGTHAELMNRKGAYYSLHQMTQQ